MSLTVLLNSVDQTTARLSHDPFVTFSLPLRGQRGTASFRIESDAGDTYKPAEGQIVEIKDDGTTVWTGTIDSITKESIGPALGNFYRCACVSEEQRLDKRTYTGVFATGTTAAAAVTLLIGTIFAAEGITLGTVDTGVTLAANAIYENARLSDVLSDLASRSGDYIWYIKAGVLYFTNNTTTSAPFNIDQDGMLDASKPSLVSNRKDYRNVQNVKISEANLTPVVESFAGDGSTFQFTVAKPIREILSIVITTSTTPGLGTAPGTGPVGTFSGLPNDGDTITIGVSPAYVFRNSPALLREVQIGVSATACASNFADAINGTGTAYWLSQDADYTAVASSGVVTLTRRNPGSWDISISEACTNFDWTSATANGTDGGVLPQSFAEATDQASMNPQWTFEAGGQVVTITGSDSPPPTDSTILITYKPIGFGLVTVKDAAGIAARAAIEGGTGIYENSVTRADILTVGDGQIFAQTLLDSYGAIEEKLAFRTDLCGLLPGQMLTVSSTRLGITLQDYLIQSVNGTFEFPDIAGNHFRYDIVLSSLAHGKTTVDALSGAFKSGTNGGSLTTAVGGGTATSSGQTPGKPGTTTSLAATQLPAIQFGLDDDTVATNAPNRYAPVTDDGSPFVGYYTVVGLPTTLDTILDVLFSTDKGSTWTSIFPPTDAQKLIIPVQTTPTTSFDANPLIRKITNFAQVFMPAGSLARLDVIQAGGATGIHVWIRSKVGGASGSQANYSRNGNGVAILNVL